MEDWMKYLLVGATGYLIGGIVGSTRMMCKACSDKTICEKYSEFCQNIR